MNSRLGDAAFLVLFAVLVLALLLRTFAPDRFRGAGERLGRSVDRTVTIRVGEEWRDPRLAAKARVGDRAEAFAGRQGVELLALDTQTARVRLRAQEVPGGAPAYGWYPLRPGAPIEVSFDEYDLAGRIVTVEE